MLAVNTLQFSRMATQSENYEEENNKCGRFFCYRDRFSRLIFFPRMSAVFFHTNYFTRTVLVQDLFFEGFFMHTIGSWVVAVLYYVKTFILVFK